MKPIEPQKRRAYFRFVVNINTVPSSQPGLPVDENTNIAAATAAIEQTHPASYQSIAAEYLTKRQVAQTAQKSVRCIDEWMKSGRLSYIKVGRSVLFRLADVQADLNRFRVNAR